MYFKICAAGCRAELHKALVNVKVISKLSLNGAKDGSLSR